MKVLDFGGRRVSVALDIAHHGLDVFLDRAGIDNGPTDLTLRVSSGHAPQLVVDIDRRHAALTIPEERLCGGEADPTVAIAVLQAAARCLALVGDDEFALLHGGAVVAAGQGVAVLDGGRGQGKTSLALALGLLGGQLLADEFLVACAVDHSVITEPAPRLPWHIRNDMAPYLLPQRPDARLAFPDHLDHTVQIATQPTVIGVVLLPDRSRPVGNLRRVPHSLTAEALLPTITDHRAKLLDPTLDHISVFTAADQLTTTCGATLTVAAGRLGRAADQLHALLADLPVYLVGIGKPSHIGVAAEAVLRMLESR